MYILILIYSLLIFIAFSYSMPKDTIVNNKYLSYFYIVIIGLMSSYMVFITEIDFTDRSVYTRIFNESVYLTLKEQMSITDLEPLYIVLTNFISLITQHVDYFYLILHIFFLCILLLGLKKIKDINFTGYAMFLFINSFFYYSYTLNGLRQGFSMALIILVIGYLIEEKKLKAIATSIVAILFHYSALPILIITFAIRYFYSSIKLKNLYFIYIILTILYVLDLQHIFVGSLNITYMEVYTSESVLDRFGNTNNINFLIFNTFFTVVFHYLYTRFYNNDFNFRILYFCYLGYTMFFLLFGFVAFSNRIASYSWFLIPLLIGYYLSTSSNNIIKAIVILGIIFIGIITGIPEYYTY